MHAVDQSRFPNLNIRLSYWSGGNSQAIGGQYRLREVTHGLSGWAQLISRIHSLFLGRNFTEFRYRHSLAFNRCPMETGAVPLTCIFGQSRGWLSRPPALNDPHWWAIVRLYSLAHRLVVLVVRCRPLSAEHQHLSFFGGRRLPVRFLPELEFPP